MGVFDKFSGINVASGFKLQAKAPLDPRAVVDTIADRDALITENGAYEGMQVYVKEDKKTYCLKSLGEKKALKVGDTLPSEIHYDTSIVPEIVSSTQPTVILSCMENDVFSYMIASTVLEDIKFLAGVTREPVKYTVLYLDSDTKTIDEINAYIAAEGLQGLLGTITEKGWQGDGVFSTGSNAGKPITVVNDPQGIFYVGGPEWEEVGAGGGSGATLLNNIVSETIVLTPDQITNQFDDTITVSFTSEQFTQMERANIIFIDASAMGEQFSDVIKIPFSKFDLKFIANTSSTVVFASSFPFNYLLITVMCSKNDDGSSFNGQILFYAAPTIPVAPYTDYYITITCRYGEIAGWGKPFLFSQGTLFASNWQSNKTQNVSIDEVIYNQDAIIVSPAGDPTDYANAGIYCSAQSNASSTLTFTCETIPTTDIQVNILIF